MSEETLTEYEKLTLLTAKVSLNIEGNQLLHTLRPRKGQSKPERDANASLAESMRTAMMYCSFRIDKCVGPLDDGSVNLDEEFIKLQLGADEASDDTPDK